MDRIIRRSAEGTILPEISTAYLRTSPSLFTPVRGLVLWRQSPVAMKQTAPQQIVTTPIEWLSPKQACRQFSIGRSSLYNLISAGRVRSKILRLRGNVRGKRLVEADSLRMLLEDADA